MNQSLIVSWVISFLMKVKALYLDSAAHHILNRLFLFFSSLWNRSRVVGWLIRDYGGSDGFFRRIFRMIMTCPQRLAEKLEKPIDKALSGSLFVAMLRGFIHSFLALNTRFLSIICYGLSISYALLFIIWGQGGISSLAIAILGLGVLLGMFDVNLIDSFAGSKIVGWIGYTFGFPFRFDFYRKEHCKNGYALVSALLVGILAGVGFYSSALLGIAVVAGVVGLTLVLYRPVVGAFAAVFLAPFVPTMILAGLVIFTFFSLLLYSLAHKEFRWRFDSVGFTLIVFMLILFISVSTSFARANSLQVWLITCVLMASYFVLVNTVRTRQQALSLLKVFAISGLFVALYGILQYVMGWGSTVANAWLDEEMFEEVKMRVYSTLENPNVLGEYLLLVGFVCAGIMWTIKEKWPKVIYAGMLVCIFICLILTQSRGCWIGLLIGIVVFVTFVNGRLWGVLPFLLILLPFILPESIVSRFASIGNLEDSSSSYRLFIWLGTIQMLKDFWISGIGMGEAAFNSVYPFYSYNAIVAPHSHNVYLQMLVDAGISGLIAFLAIAVLFLKRMSSLYRAKKGAISILAVAIGAGVIAFVVQGMFDYVFYNYRVLMIFWAVLGMGMALKYTSEEAAHD